MKKTLLQKAKEVKTHKKGRLVVGNEEIELAFAWLRDEVDLRQMSAVLGVSYTGGSSLYRVSVFLKEAYKQGKLKIKR